MRRSTSLIVQELLFRRANMLLTVAALITTVALCVALAMMHDAVQRETRRVVRDIGYNLRIIPRDTDENKFFLRGFSTKTMPVDVVHRLAKHKTIAYNHLVATLQQEVNIQGTTAMLIGLGDTLFPPGKQKPPMRAHIKPGTVEVGCQIGEQLDLKRGDTLTIGEMSLHVVRIAPSSGTRDDIGLFVHLSDAQLILDLPNQINEIKAIDCLCQASENDPRDAVRLEVEQVAPEARVFMLTQIAAARAKQRQMIKRYSAFAMPLLLLGSAIWVGTLAMLNVRQRRTEIGLLKALGYRGRMVVWLFLGRAIVLGLIAAMIGYAVGAFLGLYVGPVLFPATAKAIHAQPALAGWALIATPLLAALASLLPATLASTQDPAIVLRSD